VTASGPVGRGALGRSGNRDKWFRLAVAASAGAMYVAALFLPAVAPFNPSFSNATVPGYTAFRAWVVFIEWEPGRLDWWVLGLAWLANPAIWAAIVLIAVGCRRAAGVAAACGVTLGLVPLPWGYSSIGGLPGYWMWIGSAGLVLAASLAPWFGMATGPS
jgi:hypothetical protein